MKTVIFLMPLLAVVLAAPQKSPDGDAAIVKFNSENAGIDGYNFDFETSNGISRQEEGKLDNPQSEDANMKVVGGFSFPLPDGKTLKLTFTADENGYRPQYTISR